MSWTKEPVGGPESALNFDETSFLLPHDPGAEAFPARAGAVNFQPASGQADAESVAAAIVPSHSVGATAANRVQMEQPARHEPLSSAINNRLETPSTGIFDSRPTAASMHPTIPPVPPMPMQSPVPPIPTQSPVSTPEHGLQKASNTANGVDSHAGASKEELAHMLEGLVQVLRTGNSDVFANIRPKDHSADIMQLKELLLEAQETIIGLLNDRVLDRAKITKLESEARLLPDLQAQATRAMGLAMRSEEVQQELSHVRTEVERLRTSYVRQEQNNQGILSWFFGKK